MARPEGLIPNQDVVVSHVEHLSLPVEEEVVHEEVVEVPVILKNERVHNTDGTYAFEYETSNGIIRQESGSSGTDSQSAIGKIGYIS